MNTRLAVAALTTAILLAGFAPSAARAEPTLKWALGARPNSFEIQGAGFRPGMVLNVIELACQEMPCASGGLARIDGVVVGADGGFAVVLHTGQNDEPHAPGHDYRLVTALEQGVVATTTTPAVKVKPINHPGAVPGVPSVGTGVIGEREAHWIEAGLGLLALALILGLGSASRRRSVSLFDGVPELRLREATRVRGRAWSRMNDDEREAFYDELVHESRAERSRR